MDFKHKIRRVSHQVRQGIEQSALQFTWTTVRSWESSATDATKTFTGESNLTSTSI